MLSFFENSVLILFSLLLLLPDRSCPLFPLEVLLALPFDTLGSVELLLDFWLRLLFSSLFTCFINCLVGVLLLEELVLPDCLLIVWLLVRGRLRGLLPELPDVPRESLDIRFCTTLAMDTTGITGLLLILFSGLVFVAACWS